MTKRILGSALLIIFSYSIQAMEREAAEPTQMAAEPSPMTVEELQQKYPPVYETEEAMSKAMRELTLAIQQPTWEKMAPDTRKILVNHLLDAVLKYESFDKAISEINVLFKNKKFQSLITPERFKALVANLRKNHCLDTREVLSQLWYVPKALNEDFRAQVTAELLLNVQLKDLMRHSAFQDIRPELEQLIFNGANPKAGLEGIKSRLVTGGPINRQTVDAAEFIFDKLSQPGCVLDEKQLESLNYALLWSAQTAMENAPGAPGDLHNYGLDIVKLFLQHGADVNYQHPTTGDTPILEAAQVTGNRDENSATIRTLLEAGADPTIRNKKGKSVLDYKPYLGPLLREFEQS